MGEDRGEGSHGVRIQELVTRARRDRDQFVPPQDPPDEERAVSYLRDGFGQAVWVYVTARTGEWARFSPEEFSRLERVMNDWLELYAACYGEAITAEFSVRTAAALLIETRNVRDVAEVLTHIPREPVH